MKCSAIWLSTSGESQAGRVQRKEKRNKDFFRLTNCHGPETKKRLRPLQSRKERRDYQCEYITGKKEKETQAGGGTQKKIIARWKGNANSVITVTRAISGRKVNRKRRKGRSTGKHRSNWVDGKREKRRFLRGDPQEKNQNRKDNNSLIPYFVKKLLKRNHSSLVKEREEPLLGCPHPGGKGPKSKVGIRWQHHHGKSTTEKKRTA